LNKKNPCGYDIDGEIYDPILFGSEQCVIETCGQRRQATTTCCPDCGVTEGEIHRDCCEVEQCPKHRPQPLVSCGHYTYVIRERQPP
jgi:hypothetical protein